MSLIRPFRGLRPKPEFAQKVVAPPYDVVNRQEAAELAQGNPVSFLHIAKAEIDCDDSVSGYDDKVYQMAAHNAEQLIRDAILIQDDAEGYYIYQMTVGNSVQTGLVALVSTKAYETDRVLKHEFTQPKKEDDRVKLIKAVDGQLSPLLLSFEHQDAIRALFEKAIKQNPLYANIELDGVLHSLWHVQEPMLIEQITQAFDALPHIYVADGHHRSAAATRVANEFPERDACQYFLSVIMPDDEMTILGYHRLLRDWGPLDLTTLLEKIAPSFSYQIQAEPIIPTQASQFGLYAEGQWVLLEYIGQKDAQDPIANLDITVIHQNLIEPMFEITDPRSDERIDFVGGHQAAHKIMQRVDSGEMALGITCPATTMQQLMQVAQAGKIMPTKSTWFEPKLADGLISYRFS